jgi:hypothetical protein
MLGLCATVHFLVFSIEEGSEYSPSIEKKILSHRVTWRKHLRLILIASELNWDWYQTCLSYVHSGLERRLAAPSLLDVDGADPPGLAPSMGLLPSMIPPIGT